MSKKIGRTLLALLIIFLPSVAFAQTLSIRPALVDSTAPVEEALKRSEGQASTTLKGQGKSLLLTYTTSEPLEIFMVPLMANSSTMLSVLAS